MISAGSYIHVSKHKTKKPSNDPGGLSVTFPLNAMPGNFRTSPPWKRSVVKSQLSNEWQDRDNHKMHDASRSLRSYVDGEAKGRNTVSARFCRQPKELPAFSLLLLTLGLAFVSEHSGTGKRNILAELLHIHSMAVNAFNLLEIIRRLE